MKADPSQSHSTSSHSDAPQAAEDEWSHSDPVWKLLDKASKPQEDVFFARNVVRTARQLEQERPSLGERLLTLFTLPKITLAATACAVGLAAWQLMPSDNTAPAPDTTVQSPTEETTPLNDSTEATELSELVMLETLSAAAEDPTIFTRDEVATMIGL